MSITLVQNFAYCLIFVGSFCAQNDVDPGFKKISPKVSSSHLHSSDTITPKKQSADKVDAFLLENLENLSSQHQPRLQPVKRPRPEKSQPKAVTPAVTSAVTPAEDRPQIAHDVMLSEGSKLEAQKLPPSGEAQRGDHGEDGGGSTGGQGGQADQAAGASDVQQSSEIASTSTFRRKLQVPSGLQDETAALGVRMALQGPLGRTVKPKPGLESQPGSASSTQKGSEDPESLRLRLAKMQSKWLQDVSEDKGPHDFQHPLRISADNELKKLRGSNGWLISLMREASAVEYLPPPWRPKTGLGSSSTAEELPLQSTQVTH